MRTSSRLAIISLIVLAAGACERPSSPTGAVASSPDFLWSSGSVDCNLRHKVWQLGLHAHPNNGGDVSSQSSGQCDNMQSGVSDTIRFQYRFGGTPSILTHYLYLSKIMADGRVVNDSLLWEEREDTSWYSVALPFTPTDSIERAFVSIGHNDLTPVMLPSLEYSQEDREIVFHVWRATPSPDLSRVGDSLRLDFPRHYFRQSLERRCSGAWSHVAYLTNHTTTTHYYIDPYVSTSACDYRVQAYFVMNWFPAIGANLLSAPSITDYFGVTSDTVTWPAGSALLVQTSSLPSAEQGVAYSTTLSASGGRGTKTWSATGLPSWLALSASGVLSGTPVNYDDATFTVTVSDVSGSNAKSLTLFVHPPLVAEIAGPASVKPTATCVYVASADGWNSDSLNFAWYRTDTGEAEVGPVSAESHYSLDPPYTSGVNLRVVVSSKSGAANDEATKSISVSSTALRCFN